MIEINLVQQKKPLQIPVVLGIDLNALNFKMIIFVIILGYIADLIVLPIFVSEEGKIQEVLNKLEEQYRSIEKNLGGRKEDKVKLEAYNQHVERLKQRSAQVDAIIKQRTNPRKLLERIARTMPEDLWFEAVNIDAERGIEIKGKTESWKSIGTLISQMNEAPFFDRSMTLMESSTIEEIKGNVSNRIEVFTVKGKVTIFDPWAQ